MLRALLHAVQGVQEVVPDLFRGQYAYETTCQVRCVTLPRAYGPTSQQVTLRSSHGC